MVTAALGDQRVVFPCSPEETDVPLVCLLPDQAAWQDSNPVLGEFRAC